VVKHITRVYIRAGKNKHTGFGKEYVPARVIDWELELPDRLGRVNTYGGGKP
jgi:hypothetical protein